MGLEEDIRKDIERAIAGTPSALRASVDGPHVATPDALISALIEHQRAIIHAVYRLAREIDELRAALEGGDGDG